MRKRGSLQKNKFQRRNYLVLVTVFSIALVVLFSYGIFQNGSENSSSITGLIVGDEQSTNNLFQELADKTMEEQELYTKTADLYTKMAQNTAERQKILTQIAEQEKTKESAVAADVAPPPIAPKECTDSDGKDYYAKGTVEVLKSGQVGVDVCTGDVLKEKICSQNNNGDWAIYFDLIVCDGLCKNYACPLSTKTAKCTETDKGKDKMVKGTTKYDSTAIIKTDSCPNAGTLTEYYCEDGVIKEGSIKCASGLTCFDGACVQK